MSEGIEDRLESLRLEYLQDYSEGRSLRAESLRLEYLQDRAAGRAQEAEEKALLAHRFAKSVGTRTPNWAIKDAFFVIDIKRSIIREYASRFGRTGYVMYAWKAFLEARSIGDPPPEWVLQYLEKSASVFWDSWELSYQGHRPEVAFLEAFGIRPPRSEKKKSGRGTIWTRYEAHRLRMNFGRDVAMLMGTLLKERKRVKIDMAVEAARQNLRFPISFSKALRMWKRYKHEFPEEASKITEWYRGA
jgi:hypothetical protein